jgi:hypothetical protein
MVQAWRCTENSGWRCDRYDKDRSVPKIAHELPMISINQPQQLRRTIAPYVGQLIIFSLVTLGVLLVSVQKHVLSLILPVPIMWLLFAFLVCIGLRYRIVWTNNEVCQRASGGSNVCIEYGQITRITSEVSKPGEWFAASRPFRRIVIYAQGGEDKFIDVSLKHFLADDIRELMRAIRIRRPDLELPSHWA